MLDPDPHAQMRIRYPAHQNLSEVLPLTVLGCVLGFVYTRSKNLLSSMLVHSLWNGGTLLSLFLLGSGAG